MTWQRIGVITAAILGISGVAGAVGYQFDRPAWHSEVQELAAQVASNARTLALQKWEYLHAKKQNKGLTAAEQAVYCELSAQLRFQGIGCR